MLPVIALFGLAWLAKKAIDAGDKSSGPSSSSSSDSDSDSGEIREGPQSANNWDYSSVSLGPPSSDGDSSE